MKRCSVETFVTVIIKYKNIQFKTNCIDKQMHLFLIMLKYEMKQVFIGKKMTQSE